MSKIKLKSFKYSKNQYAGQSLQFPVIGEAQFDENQILEVEEDKVIAFIKATEDSFDFGLLDPEPLTVTGLEVDNDVKSESEQKKSGRPSKISKLSKEDQEMISLIEAANTSTLLAFVAEIDDEDFKQKACNMTDDRIKKELVKRITSK